MLSTFCSVNTDYKTFANAGAELDSIRTCTELQVIVREKWLMFTKLLTLPVVFFFAAASSSLHAEDFFWQLLQQAAGGVQKIFNDSDRCTLRTDDVGIAALSSFNCFCASVELIR